MKPSTARTSVLTLYLFISGAAYSQNPTREEINCMEKIRPTTAYQYFSGFSSEYSNIPTMYAYYKSAKEGMVIVVIAPNFFREFPTEKYSSAVKAYKELLTNTAQKLNRKNPQRIQ